MTRTRQGEDDPPLLGARAQRLAPAALLRILRRARRRETLARGGGSLTAGG